MASAELGIFSVDVPFVLRTAALTAQCRPIDRAHACGKLQTYTICFLNLTDDDIPRKQEAFAGARERVCQ